MSNTIKRGDLVSWRLGMLGDHYYPRRFGVVVEKTTIVGHRVKQNAYRVIDSSNAYRVIPARYITKECG